MIIETKYDVGDSVFAGKAEWSETHVECPDCAGTEKWTITAAKHTWEAECQTCRWARFHGTRPPGTVKKSVRLPLVEFLTIGSVRLNTEEEGHTYMCVETGVGTGRVHKEKSLFATFDEAFAFAEDEVKRQLPEAHTDDQRRNDWDRKENMCHVTRPEVKILTEKTGKRWSARIEGGPQAMGSTKFTAVEALAILLAK